MSPYDVTRPRWVNRTSVDITVIGIKQYPHDILLSSVATLQWHSLEPIYFFFFRPLDRTVSYTMMMTLYAWLHESHSFEHNAIIKYNCNHKFWVEIEEMSLISVLVLYDTKNSYSMIRVCKNHFSGALAMDMIILQYILLFIANKAIFANLLFSRKE